MCRLLVRAVGGALRAFLSCIALFGGLGSSQTPMMQPSGGGAPLDLVISCSKARIRLNDSFILSARLLNVSNESVSLFGQLLWGDGGGLTLHVLDQNGQTVYAMEHDDGLVVPTMLTKRDSYVVLFPDHYLGIERKDKQSNLFPKVGCYSLFAEYRSPVPGRYAKTLNFWGRERGFIRSAPIRIEVEIGNTQSLIPSAATPTPTTPRTASPPAPSIRSRPATPTTAKATACRRPPPA